MGDFEMIDLKIKKIERELNSFSIKTLQKLKHVDYKSLKINGTYVYDTIVLQDNETTLDGVNYADVHNDNHRFNLTNINTLKFIYNFTGINPKFYISRWRQYIDENSTVMSEEHNNEEYTVPGVYVFKRTYIRNGDSSNDPFRNYFELVAFFSNVPV